VTSAGIAPRSDGYTIAKGDLRMKKRCFLFLAAAMLAAFPLWSQGMGGGMEGGMMGGFGPGAQEPETFTSNGQQIYFRAESASGKPITYTWGFFMHPPWPA
jgi:hypothetical protein